MTLFCTLLMYVSAQAAGVSFVDSGLRMGFSDGATMSVAVCDVNGDGLEDIVFGNYYYEGPYPHGGEVHLNQGNVTFLQTGQELRTSGSWYSYQTSVAAGDVDGDDDVDLVVSDHAYLGVPDRVFLNGGDGLFDWGSAVGDACTWCDMLADLDGDGDLDLAIGESNYNYVRGWTDHSGVLTYFNDGSGQFSGPAQVLGLGTDCYCLDAADLDADGDMDMVSGSDGPERVFINDGTGHFVSSPQTLGPTGGRGQVACADLDGDADIDIVSHNGVFLNDGAASFTQIQAWPGPWVVHYIALGDVDLDGDPDCLARSSQWEASFALDLYLNDGAGQLTWAGVVEAPPEGWGLYDFALTDVDSDRDLDLALGMFHGPNLILLNTAADDNAPPALSMSSPSPAVLWPPDHRLVPVTISGTVFDEDSGIESAWLVVDDDYEAGTTSHDITDLLGPQGGFEVVLELTAWRDGGDPDGRQYAIELHASDVAGNDAAPVGVAVCVPHDHGTEDWIE
jgi:hypothetical protein